MKRLVLLGGGHAHVHVLRSLALEPQAGAEVVLVTPFLRQMYSGMVPGLEAGHYTAEQCAIPLAPLARAATVEALAPPAATLLKQLLLELLERQVSHIQKETMALLPLLDDLLDEEADRRLAFEYAAGCALGKI